MLTIIMYHYVRDLSHTAYPGIKGLRTAWFEGQLDYVDRHYTVCSLADVLRAIRGERALPHNACLLTFDDGLRDHYETVFPRLAARNYTGVFAVSGGTLNQDFVLDVHKVQFLLAVTGDVSALRREVEDLVRASGGERASEGELGKQATSGVRFDTEDVIWIKRQLQWALPEAVRRQIARELFLKHVTRDEAGFAGELYANATELREMAAAGMELAGHGQHHEWMGKMSRDEQRVEIEQSVRCLTRILGRKPADWTMCYPFGSYNSDTMELLQNQGCALGLTVRVGLAGLESPLELARIDTNDLPVSGDAAIAPWTLANA
jgi:peptidoglycan/xylan/chitin deacetylase (PgdA/CDA1 family)